MSDIKIVTATAPAHWAPYLVNGDSSVFVYYTDNDTDQADADKFAATYGNCVDAAEIGFQPFCDAPGELPGNMALYTFHTFNKKEVTQ